MMDYTYMRLLADEVLRQARAASHQVTMSTLDVAPGTEHSQYEIYSEEKLLSKSATTFRAGIRGGRETRLFVYEGKLPWIVDEAIDRAIKQDKNMWEHVLRDVSHAYTLKQVETWKYYEWFISNSLTNKQSEN